jgi:MerR family transcriptional regulator/heat shock protein HspR
VSEMRDQRTEKKDRRRREKDEDALFAEDQGVFMISVAAQLAGMHPQTLRIYEERGLIKPARSPKQTRLYSQRDVERLRRIQELTTEFGMNLAGVERVLALEEVMDAMQRRLDSLSERAREMEREILERIEEIHRSYKRELVPWEPPGSALGLDQSKSFNIPIQKGRPAASRRTGPGRDGRSGSR